jgi:sulfur carrier protein
LVAQEFLAPRYSYTGAPVHFTRGVQDGTLEAVESTQTVRILLNGESRDLSSPMTVQALLQSLGIDSRRVAVEHNLVVVRRAHYGTELVSDGDEVEIVNFVGGG